MEISEILKRCDHTLLSQTATLADILALCDEGIKYKTASVCIPPSYVRAAKEYVCDRLKICTVIGFPNGYSVTSAKAIEAREAVNDGADEIDMVINIGALKDGRYGEILDEINAVKAACCGRVLKVIIETALLSQEEKVKMCEIVSASDADYIKTSTGFANGGATPEDVVLFKAHVTPRVKIKAAGGIASLEDAENFIRLGADRLGTSRIVKILKNQESNGY